LQQRSRQTDCPSLAFWQPRYPLSVLPLEDRRLCVPASRRVCPFQTKGSVDFVVLRGNVVGRET